MLPAVQSIQALEKRNVCSADDVEAVLLWHQPMRSSKAFLGGMYILICLRQLVLGLPALFMLSVGFRLLPGCPAMQGKCTGEKLHRGGYFLGSVVPKVPTNGCVY